MSRLPLRHRFGRFEVRPLERRLLVDGQPAAVGARAFDLLLALIEHRERMLSKSELLELVWPRVIVEEGNLQVQVSALRKVLGAEAIATIPRHGYRFAAALIDAPRRSRGATLARTHYVAQPATGLRDPPS